MIAVNGMVDRKKYQFRISNYSRSVSYTHLDVYKRQVRNRRNKVIFQLLRFGQLPCHIIDYITQLADLIVIFLFQPNTEIPLGNLSGSLPYLSQRDDNGIDKICLLYTSVL